MPNNTEPSIVVLRQAVLEPRGQAVLEAKILSSASKICLWPRTRPRAFVLGLSSNFMLASCTPLCLSSISSFMVVFNYLLVYEV